MVKTFGPQVEQTMSCLDRGKEIENHGRSQPITNPI